MKALLAALLCTFGFANTQAAEIHIYQDYFPKTGKFTGFLNSTTEKPVSLSQLVFGNSGFCYVGTETEVQDLLERMRNTMNSKSDKKLGMTVEFQTHDDRKRYLHLSVNNNVIEFSKMPSLPCAFDSATPNVRTIVSGQIAKPADGSDLQKNLKQSSNTEAQVTVTHCSPMWCKDISTTTYSTAKWPLAFNAISTGNMNCDDEGSYCLLNAVIRKKGSSDNSLKGTFYTNEFRFIDRQKTGAKLELAGVRRADVGELHFLRDFFRIEINKYTHRYGFSGHAVSTSDALLAFNKIPYGYSTFCHSGNEKSVLALIQSMVGLYNKEYPSTPMKMSASFSDHFDDLFKENERYLNISFVQPGTTQSQKYPAVLPCHTGIAKPMFRPVATGVVSQDFGPTAQNKKPFEITEKSVIESSVIRCEGHDCKEIARTERKLTQLPTDFTVYTTGTMNCDDPGVSCKLTVLVKAEKHHFSGTWDNLEIIDVPLTKGFTSELKLKAKAVPHAE